MRSRAGLALLALLGGACSGQPRGLSKAREASTSTESLAPLYVTPAHWDYHPTGPDGAIAAVEIPGGGCVFTADGGQRWTSASVVKTGAAGEPSRCAGRATASEFLAPEELVSAIRREGKPWLFVGASGALYESAEPLGPFTRTISPPEPLARVAAAAASVLATTYDGKLLRWEEARGWRPAPSPPSARVLDVAMAGPRALSLAFPEALFASSDGGVTWAPASAPPIGARRLGLTSDGDLGVQGLFESIRWDPGPGVTFTRSKRALHARSASLDVDVGRGARASAVQKAGAVIDGERYVEVVRPETEGDLWQLARGRIEGRLDVVSLPWSSPCGSLRVGMRGKTIYTACVSLDGSDIAAAVRRSRDGGTTWSAPLGLTTPDTDQITIAVSPDGSALISGVCKGQSEPASCKPTAPLLIREDAPAAPVASSTPGATAAPVTPRATTTPVTPRATTSGLTAMTAGAPQLTALALLPAFSFDGRSAYFLGMRGKDEKLTLFVSHDAGETFSQRSLETPGPKLVRRPRDYDDDEGPEEAVDDYIEVDDTSTIHPGEDGTVGLMVIRYRGFTYVTTDEDGRVLHETATPNDDAVMAGFGRRVVAVTGHDGATVSESSDGGATWEEQPAPAALAREIAQGNSAISCGVAGCLFGDSVARVGWGGQGGPSAIERPEGPTPTSSPAVLTPIVCELAATSRWTRVDNVQASEGGILPQLNQIMRGRSVWSVLTSSPASDAVATLSATLPESGEGDAKVVIRSLLAARGARERSRTVLSFQMEGYAAVRAPAPLDKDGAVKPGAPLHNVEVAWENFMEGSAGHGKIPDAGPLTRRDVTTTSWFAPSLITVSVKGMVIAPHAAAEPDQAFLIDLAGKASRIEMPTFPSVGLEGRLDVRRDMTLIGGAPLGVGMVRDGNGDVLSVLLARRAQDRWDIGALGFAPERGDGPLLSHADWTYSGRSAIGMTSLTADRRRPRAWAAFEPFRADGTFGPPEPLPTLYDLGDRPRPCSAADRANGPRFEAILASRDEVLFAGMRHPVLVSEAPAKNAVGVSPPITLLTAGAITYGSPAAPCSAGWEASGVARAGVTAVLSGDLARSWLFRIASPAPSPPNEQASTSIEYRPMTCRFDPAAPIPDSVWGEKGTARIER